MGLYGDFGPMHLLPSWLGVEFAAGGLVLSDLWGHCWAHLRCPSEEILSGWPPQQAALVRWALLSVYFAPLPALPSLCAPIARGSCSSFQHQEGRLPEEPSASERLWRFLRTLQIAFFTPHCSVPTLMHVICVSLAHII